MLDSGGQFTFFSSFVLMKPSLSRSKILNASLIVSASSSCNKSKGISAKDASPKLFLEKKLKAEKY